MKHLNLISIIAAVVAGVFGAFPVTVHANNSPLIAMTMVAGGVGGALPVSVDAKKAPLVALAAGVGISTLPVPVHAGDRKCTRGDYGCGKGKGTAPYWTQTCAASKCCCKSESYDHFRHDTCEGYERKTKGCDSCLGYNACKNVASTVKIGDQSCVNHSSCEDVKGDSIIWNHSCRSMQGCHGAKNVVIGPNSCGIGKYEEYACYYLKDSKVGSNSCQKNNSCCLNYGPVTIGDDACNLDSTCSLCASGSTVPNGACSTAGGADVYEKDGEWKCKYCDVSTILSLSLSPTTTKRNPFILL